MERVPSSLFSFVLQIKELLSRCQLKGSEDAILKVPKRAKVLSPSACPGFSHRDTSSTLNQRYLL
jgi:hypothetical protein